MERPHLTDSNSRWARGLSLTDGETLGTNQDLCLQRPPRQGGRHSLLISLSPRPGQSSAPEKDKGRRGLATQVEGSHGPDVNQEALGRRWTAPAACRLGRRVLPGGGGLG